MRSTLLGVTLVVMTTSCDLVTATARGISIQLLASPLVAQTGDTVTFIVDVSANNVSGVVINYGDSGGDQQSIGGAPTARVTFKHAYADTGSYTARATVSDAVVGERNVTQVITVNARTDSASLRR
jgi:hypothetical protein